MSSPRSHPAPAYASASARQHPYAAHSRHRATGPRRPSPMADDHIPPSPPHSRRDSAQGPAMKPQPPAMDHNDNYWDDVPAPPASLKSILDSFRASGEGDRELLMAILGAKKAEEERLTSIIQTRLTVLQARLNLAAIQAQLASPTPDYAEFQAHGHPHERTPSLSHSSSSAPQSPPLPHMHPVNGYYDRMPMGYDRMDRLPPIHRERSDSCGSRRRNDGLEMLLEGVREAERKERA